MSEAPNNLKSSPLCTKSVLRLNPHCRALPSTMQPPHRSTRSTTHPGVVDQPKPRRSPSEVAAQKLKSQEAAAAKTRKRQEQTARVARVEEEIMIAQKEERGSRRGRGAKKLNKNYPEAPPDLVGDEDIGSSKVFPISSQTCLLPHSHLPLLGEEHQIPVGRRSSSPPSSEAQSCHGTAV